MKTPEQISEELKAPFPEDQISWRIQGKPFERDGKWSGLALAYIDARDVMNRLDEVVGSDGWQDRYQDTPNRTYCTLKVNLAKEGQSGWIEKSDAAGDSEVEAEKGAVSDAFKRAAVKFGIGRYLYDLDSPWVECKVYKNSRGDMVWKEWVGNPWDKVKRNPDTLNQYGFTNAVTRNEYGKLTLFAIEKAANLEELEAIKVYCRRVAKTDKQFEQELSDKFKKREIELKV